MRRGGQILIILGIFLGLASFGGVWYVLQQGGGGGGGGSQDVPKTKVIVAIQKINAHSIIPAQGAFEVKDWPSDAVPPNAVTVLVTDTTGSAAIANIANKLAAVTIERGQPIGKDMIIDKQGAELFKGYGSDASALVPKGKVLVSFPINQQTSIAGAIRPADRVDIIVSYPMAQTTATNAPQASSIRQITQYTLQNVEIVWVGLWPVKAGEQATEDSRNAAFVTFLVDRQDALVLKFLRETALETQFALRAAGDRDTPTVEPVVIEYIDQRFNFQGSLGRSR